MIIQIADSEAMWVIVGATLVVAQPAPTAGNHKGCPYSFITHIASLPITLTPPLFKGVKVSNVQALISSETQ